MKTSKIYLALIFLSFQFGFGQMSGNVVFRDNNYFPQNKIEFALTDNSLTLKVSIMMNKTADSYLISLGLNEEATTVALCNSAINKRIYGFMESLSKLGISEKDVYADFISQAKIYDYSLEDGKALQFEKGYEIKKNVIIATASLKNIDKIIEAASLFKIYDIIKIDYLSNDTGGLYASLLDEALKIGDSKKEKYLKSFNKKSIGNPTSSGELMAYTPLNQYKSYKAFESSEVEAYYGSSDIARKIAGKTIRTITTAFRNREWIR
ncbi:MAG: SIMPL domain-containing protein [Flavobacterium sp.]